MKPAGFIKSGFFLFFLLSYANFLYSQEKLPAFPTAEGGGKWTTGGRGGEVYVVKSLGDFGAALKKPGPRTIVFAVSGNIDGNFTIPSNTTIAGQTAPGDGICINGQVQLESNVILRYIRIRGKPSQDCLGAREKKDIVVDHVTTSWSKDENLSIYHCENVTIQWCLVSQAMGGGHGFAGIWGGNMNTQHHNLIAHNTGRNPRFCGGARNNDYRNNVTYNWGKHPCKGGEDKQNFDTKGIWIFTAINWVANYNKPGPTTAANRVKFITPGGGSWYVKDNYMAGHPDLTADNWKGVTGGKKLNEPAPHIPMLHQQTAEEAYESVLKYVGCSFPKRDSNDEIVVNDVREGIATHGNKGMVTNPSQVGGLPELKSEPAPPDGDNDGMPDAWEKAHGLNPADAKDRNGIGAGGYTNLEVYMNSLVASNTYIKNTVETKKPVQKFDFALKYDNLFHSSSKVSFSIPKRSKVKLEVFDNTGRKVAILVDAVKDAGKYSVDFSGSHLSTGLYVCKLTAVNKSLTRKMFLIK